MADIVVTDDALGTNELSLSGADASSFVIDGLALYLKADTVLDYETNPVLNVTVAVDDADVGGTPDDTAALAITVTEVSDNAIDVELVALLTPSGSDTLGTLPSGVSEVKAGDTFYIEIWLKNVDGSTNGITGGYIDFSFDSTLLTGGVISNGSIYTTFSGGTVDNASGLIDDLGGNASPGVVDKGDDEWVRLGYVEFTADAEGTVDFITSAGIDTFARATEGGVAWASVQMNAPQKSVLIEPLCIYDLDEDGFIGTGDYGIFSPAWHSSQGDPNWNEQCDFDGDGFIGTGDWSWFSLNWHKDADDPSVAYPPAPSATVTSGQPLFSLAMLAEETSSYAIDVELVPVLSVLGSDVSSTLPSGISQIDPGGSFYVEVWIQNVDGSTNGITGGYIDFSFDESLITGTALSNGGTYTIFADGSVDNTSGLVDNLGGNASPGVVDKGDDEWVRLGYIEFTADAVGTVDFIVSAGIDTFARATEGGISWADIELNSPAVSLVIGDVNEAPSVALSNTNISLAEDTDTTVRLKVADIVVTDGDALGTNELSLIGDDAALFEIDGFELYLKAGTVLDYETNPVLDVTVEVDDTTIGSTPDDTASLSITVTNVNEAAPTVALENRTTELAEDTDTTVRLKVADIVVTDGDALGTNELSLIGDDAALFEIDGFELYLKAGTVLDYETNPVLDVTVEVDDTTIGSTPDDTASLSITVTDITESLNYDIDDNGSYSALTDGVLVVRYLFGFRGDTLINGAIDPGANRSTPDEIEAYLAFLEASGILDIDGNGSPDALTDGVLLVRYLFGFRGDTLIDGTVGTGAIRATAPEIEAYIASYIPSLVSQLSGQPLMSRTSGFKMLLLSSPMELTGPSQFDQPDRYKGFI